MFPRFVERLPRCVRWPVAAAIALTAVSPLPAGAATTLASHDDAFISRDSPAETWSIGSREIELVVGIDAAGTLAPQRLFNPLTGRPWTIVPSPDVSVSADGEPLILSASKGFRLIDVTAQDTGAGVLLVFMFQHSGLRLQVHRSYASYPGSPAIETWTRISGDGSALLSNMVGWQLTMPLGTVKWLGGLRRDSVPGELEPFELAERDLEQGEHWEIGATARSTEQYVPFVVIDDGREAFFGGVMWSGRWRLTSDRVGNRIRVGASFSDSPAVGPGRAIEVPHTFFGFTSYPSTPSDALRQFIMRGIRHGRPFVPLVTYNTWFAYGTGIDEIALVDEIDRAAALGVELFVVDAGWYGGTGVGGGFDFESGLGSLAADPDRFPTGLPSLADSAHNAGMKFGLWVEPERVALDLVAHLTGLGQTWLATRDGFYGSDTVAQICLAGPQAREWLLDRLTTLVQAVGPDYLKWDNNGWINCNRPGHGHGKDDGNFAHVEGLYDVLARLRQRFPDLLIENVSGGGNRLDFGMLALTDVGWMDDLSAPSAHVRHNLEGLSFALPPAYLLSFIIAGEGEALDTGHDLPNIVRSRMPGAIGMTFRSSELDQATFEQLAEEIQRYKGIRDILARSSATLLSRQAPTDADSWDVLQEVAEDGLSAVLFAFKNDVNEGRLLVRLRGLRGEIMYDVQSADAGLLGSATGDELMRDGIELAHADGSLAHLLVLTAQP